MLAGNIAYRKMASQGATFSGNKWGPSKATDGATIGTMWDGTCSYSLMVPETQPAWWQVDLGGPHVIFNVTVYNNEPYCKSTQDTF